MRKTSAVVQESPNAKGRERRSGHLVTDCRVDSASTEGHRLWSRRREAGATSPADHLTAAVWCYLEQPSTESELKVWEACGWQIPDRDFFDNVLSEAKLVQAHEERWVM